MENRKAAIEWFSMLKEKFAKTEYEDYLDMAISALEKQETAKIVVGKSRGGVTLWHECGKCGEPVDAKDIFCRRCGRKLIPLPEPCTEEENDKP